MKKAWLWLHITSIEKNGGWGVCRGQAPLMQNRQFDPKPCNTKPFRNYITTARGVTSIIKVYTDVRLEWGISMGYLFRPKSIWMGKIWKIVYGWVQFSLWEVYERVCFLILPSIWIGWGPGLQPHVRTKIYGMTTPPPPWNYTFLQILYCIA